MTLANFEPITEIVDIRSKAGKISVTVRGLGLHDISQLMRTHAVDLEGLIGIYENSAGSEFTAVALGKFVMELIRQAPGLVAHIIALAADEPSMAEKAGKLGFMDQVKLLKSIGTMTFDEIGGVKKMTAELAGLWTSLQHENSADKTA